VYPSTILSILLKQILCFITYFHHFTQICNQVNIVPNVFKLFNSSILYLHELSTVIYFEHKMCSIIESSDEYNYFRSSVPLRVIVVDNSAFSPVSLSLYSYNLEC
jgi:hypothetical protein